MNNIQTTINTKANAADVYTKQETDSAISTAIDNIPDPDLSSYATKSYVDTTFATKTELNTKANAADVYTKQESDNKYATKTELNTKANAADVYTKQETDSAISTAISDIPDPDLSSYAKLFDTSQSITAKDYTIAGTKNNKFLYDTDHLQLLNTSDSKKLMRVFYDGKTILTNSTDSTSNWPIYFYNDNTNGTHIGVYHPQNNTYDPYMYFNTSGVSFNKNLNTGNQTITANKVNTNSITTGSMTLGVSNGWHWFMDGNNRDGSVLYQVYNATRGGYFQFNTSGLHISETTQIELLSNKIKLGGPITFDNSINVNSIVGTTNEINTNTSLYTSGKLNELLTNYKYIPFQNVIEFLFDSSTVITNSQRVIISDIGKSICLYSFSGIDQTLNFSGYGLVLRGKQLIITQNTIDLKNDDFYTINFPVKTYKGIRLYSFDINNDFPEKYNDYIFVLGYVNLFQNYSITNFSFSTKYISVYINANGSINRFYYDDILFVQNCPTLYNETVTKDTIFIHCYNKRYENNIPKMNYRILYVPASKTFSFSGYNTKSTIYKIEATLPAESNGNYNIIVNINAHPNNPSGNPEYAYYHQIFFNTNITWSNNLGWLTPFNSYNTTEADYFYDKLTVRNFN